MAGLPRKWKADVKAMEIEAVWKSETVTNWRRLLMIPGEDSSFSIVTVQRHRKSSFMS
jgi:hypothetical protein